MTQTPTLTSQDIGQAEKATRAVLGRFLAQTGTGFHGWVILNVLSRIIAPSHPIPAGAPIRLTKNTSASPSTPRNSPISVGSMYTTTMITTNSKTQNTPLSARASGSAG
jgi:hypothetical protein